MRRAARDLWSGIRLAQASWPRLGSLKRLLRDHLHRGILASGKLPGPTIKLPHAATAGGKQGPTGRARVARQQSRATANLPGGPVDSSGPESRDHRNRFVRRPLLFLVSRPPQLPTHRYETAGVWDRV